ncbi:hypothetical protein BS78_02G194000 [Paspalum vaginatum]|nr:hypothetical protein BS78_02G194000 [Paspalum vaginatum]
MASQSHHDALWAKLHQLELQLAAYKLLRAARGEDAGASGCAGRRRDAGGRQHLPRQAVRRLHARRDARRLAASAEQHQPLRRKAQKPRATPMSPRAARCGARDAHEAGAATPRPVGAQAKRTPSILPVPSTPRRELPRSRTASGAAAACGSPARPPSHQRRSSLGAAAELGECATPRPFLKRGTGTGGAAAPARARVHDLPAIDVARRHPEAGARPGAAPRARPAAMYSAANSHGRDLSKGLRKLLSFVRKGGRSGGGGDQAAVPAPSPRGGGKPVTVSKGWSGCSPVDVPLDRGASLEGHRFPMTRAVGISG